MSYSFAQIKTAMQKFGYPVSAGGGWTNVDQGSYDNLFVPSAAYTSGKPVDKVEANYGVAYPAVMPSAVGYSITNNQGGTTPTYSASASGYPAVGYAPLSVTFTVGETGAHAQQFSWNFEDGATPVPTQNNVITHTYNAAGTYYAKVTPTWNGAPQGPYKTNVIVVGAPQ